MLRLCLWFPHNDRFQGRFVTFSLLAMYVCFFVLAWEYICPVFIGHSRCLPVCLRASVLCTDLPSWQHSACVDSRVQGLLLLGGSKDNKLSEVIVKDRHNTVLCLLSDFIRHIHGRGQSETQRYLMEKLSQNSGLVVTASLGLEAISLQISFPYTFCLLLKAVVCVSQRRVNKQCRQALKLPFMNSEIRWVILTFDIFSLLFSQLFSLKRCACRGCYWADPLSYY